MVTGAKSMGEVMTAHSITKRIEIYLEAVWIAEDLKPLIVDFFTQFLTQRLVSFTPVIVETF